jgi:hypothetical protein
MHAHQGHRNSLRLTALRGEQFCYFHQRMVRGVTTPAKARLHPVALIEDEESLQASLMEIINALARNSIDLRRAEPQVIPRTLYTRGFLAGRRLISCKGSFDSASACASAPLRMT